MVVATDQEIAKIAALLHNVLQVEYVAPGHCTGEPAFAALKKTYGEHYLYAGVGTTVTTASLRQ